MGGEIEDLQDHVKEAEEEVSIVKERYERKLLGFERTLSAQLEKQAETNDLLAIHKKQQVDLQAKLDKLIQNSISNKNEIPAIKKQSYVANEKNEKKNQSSQRQQRQHERPKEDGDAKTADVLLFHDSLGKKINNTIFKHQNLTTAKILTYHLGEIRSNIPKRNAPPRACIIHTLTNDVTKNKDVNSLTKELDSLVDELKTTFPTTKIIVSNIVSRDTHKQQVEYINAYMNINHNNNNVSTCSHKTIRYEDRWNDGIHLEQSGTNKLASDLKKSTMKALGLPKV